MEPRLRTWQLTATAAGYTSTRDVVVGGTTTPLRTTRFR